MFFRTGFFHRSWRETRVETDGLNPRGTDGSNPSSSSRESGANLSEPIEVHTLTKGWMGTRLIREWQGRTYEVVVLDDGFSWQGFTALRVFHLSNVSAHPGKRLRGQEHRLRHDTTCCPCVACSVTKFAR